MRVHATEGTFSCDATISPSIALSGKATFSMGHLKRVLEAAQALENEMRGDVLQSQLGFNDR